VRLDIRAKRSPVVLPHDGYYAETNWCGYGDGKYEFHMSYHDSMGPQRHNEPRGILFHRHSAKSEKLGLGGSKGDGHPTGALPSAAMRPAATEKYRPLS